MESRPNSHPVYVSGQYLTSEHLNETHNFLWQEEKATRYLLAGNGIARGLQPAFTGSTILQNISLTKGAASTIDGLIVQAEENIAFNKALAIVLIKYKITDGAEILMEEPEFEKVKQTLPSGTPVSLNGFEIFSDSATENDLPDGTKPIDNFGITNSDATSKFLLIAWVDIKDAENNQCQQGDCNTKGVERNYKVRYFLVNNSGYPQQNSVSVEMPTCAVARIKNMSKAGSKDGLNQASFAAWSAGFAELNGYFVENSGKQLKNVAQLLAPDDQAVYQASAAKFLQINVSVNNKSCSQYYNGFASDLAKAINELVVYYNDYAKQNAAISANRIERTIVIGSLQQAGVDSWRYYFIPAPEILSGRFDISKLKKLFRRVLAMVDNFIPQNSLTKIANAVPVKPLAIPTLVGDALLQNCAIPYYYDIKAAANTENDVLKYWNPQGGNLKNIYCYYDSLASDRADMAAKLTTADWTNQNFFRIEGHIGMSKQTAITTIGALIKNEGLPIQLIECDVNYKGPKKWIDWYNSFVTNVAVWTKDLRTDYKAYDFSPIKKIQESITQTSYRDVNEVIKIYNDFSAYSGVFYSLPSAKVVAGAARAAAAPNANAKAAAANPKGIPDTAYEQFKRVVPKASIDIVNKGFKDAVAEQSELQASKLIVLSDLIDLEYMGGALRGGTFVLLHDGTNVIGDGCLPYYYRITQSRVFNA